MNTKSTGRYIGNLDIEDKAPRPNLNPEIHGSPVWETWNHLASQANTPRRRQKVKYWVEEILTDMFGCEKCRKHIPAHLKKFPIDEYMESAEQMLLHAFLVHDSVSRSIPGKTNLPSFADIKKIYFPSKEVSCHTICTDPTEEEEVEVEAEVKNERRPAVSNMSQKRTAPASMSKKLSPTRTVAPQIENQRQQRFVRKQ